MRKCELVQEFCVILVLIYIVYNVVANDEIDCSQCTANHFFDGNIPGCTECRPECRGVAHPYFENCQKCCLKDEPTTKPSSSPSNPNTTDIDKNEPTTKPSSSPSNSSTTGTDIDERLVILVAVLVPILFIIIVTMLFCAIYKRRQRVGYGYDNDRQHTRDGIEMRETQSARVDLHPESSRTVAEAHKNNNDVDKETQNSQSNAPSCSKSRNVTLSNLKSTSPSWETLSSEESVPQSPHEDHNLMPDWDPRAGPVCTTSENEQKLKVDTYQKDEDVDRSQSNTSLNGGLGTNQGNATSLGTRSDTDESLGMRSDHDTDQNIQFRQQSTSFSREILDQLNLNQTTS